MAEGAERGVEKERGKDEEMEKIEWHRDPAASGWRSRAFLRDGELLAYDDGRWELRLKPVGFASASGRERSGDLAKRA